MICVQLAGGLGNQLFQYAAGRALACRHNTELLLNSSKLQGGISRATPRKFELHRFNCAGRFASPHERQGFKWLRLMPTFSPFLRSWKLYVERSVAFNPEFNTLKNETYLVGYWQSYRYFECVASQIAVDLTPIMPLSSRSLEVAARIELSNSLAIHVRRGDYVSLKSAAKVHGVLPHSYYSNALFRSHQLLNSPKIFVFSDDPNWCRVNLELGENATFISHNLGEDAWQDLILMGLCKHHIIANSSFSWWGAWLADQHLNRSQRLVIAPEQWFSGMPKQHLNDRFPPHWEVLS